MFLFTHNRLLNRILALLLSCALAITHATVAFGQSSPDTRSPVIELEVVAEATADVTQVFTAQVVDDRQLKDVILYYRREGQLPYMPLAMTRLAESDYFTASISTEPDDLRTIQYYVQARDDGGNRTVEGFAFDPYNRLLLANTSLQATTPAPTAPAPTATTGGIKWWHIALGALVAGALVGAAGGSGGSSGDDGVPLSVTVTGF